MEIEKKIKEVLNKLRPYLQNDGGDVIFQKYENGVVYVKLTGACSNCPLIDSTLEDGIEEAIINEVPEVIKVVFQIGLFFPFNSKPYATLNALLNKIQAPKTNGIILATNFGLIIIKIPNTMVTIPYIISKLSGIFFSLFLKNLIKATIPSVIKTPPTKYEITFSVSSDLTTNTNPNKIKILEVI